MGAETWGKGGQGLYGRREKKVWEAGFARRGDEEEV